MPDDAQLGDVAAPLGGRRTAGSALRRIRLDVRGVVQGVGFRPFVVVLAARHGLTGYVANDASGVEVEVEGASDSVDAFLRQLPEQAPALARITAVRAADVAIRGSRHMEIVASKVGQLRAAASALVPPDVAVCDDCLRELRDASDRRYRYAFTCCTNCGPRYTVIRDLPHDRQGTTMVRFTMCDECRREYEDPHDRRFHAQANSCPACGPAITLSMTGGPSLPYADPLREAGRLLFAGRIRGQGNWWVSSRRRRNQCRCDRAAPSTETT